MKKKIFIFLFILAIGLGCNSFIKAQEAAPTNETTASQFDTAKGLLEKGGEGNFNTAVDGDELYRIIGRGIEAVLGVIGIILIIIIIYSGYLWFSAGGNEDQITQSKSYISNAVIGLAVVLSAYAVTYFIMSKVTGIIANI